MCQPLLICIIWIKVEDANVLLKKVADSFGNNATTKILGIEYQKLIALEKCLGAKSNEIIWLECFGDVSDSDTSTEVKHHLTNRNLTDCSIDFWKTLRNFVREKHLVNQFITLILHTTAKIKDDSIFYGWDDLDKVDKLKKLKLVKPTDEIKKMYSEIFQIKDNDILEILNKFKIEFSQPKINEKLDQIRQHPAMTAVPEKYKDVFLQWLIGYITKRAIDNRDKWHIDRNSFERDFQCNLKQYLQEDIPFPFVIEGEVDSKKNNNFRFIEELKAIKYERKIDKAVSDYLRANLSRIRLLESTPSVDTSLDIFDRELHDDLIDKKITHGEDISIEILDTIEAHKESRKLYDNCINMQLKIIQGVQPIQKYYQSGRIHYIVEDGEFKWKFEVIDL